MSYRTKNGVCSSFEKTKGRWDGRAGPKTEKRRAGTLKQEQHQKNQQHVKNYLMCSQAGHKTEQRRAETINMPRRAETLNAARRAGR